VPGATRWFQPVYPLLRNSAKSDGRLMFRQLPSPGVKGVECVVVNHSSRTIGAAKMRVTLAAAGRDYALGEAAFREVAPFDEQAVRLGLKLPNGLKGVGEIRLHLIGEGVDGRNSYAVTLHDAAEAAHPFVPRREVVLAKASPRTEAALDRLGIGFRLLSADECLPSSSVLVVPPEGSVLNDVQMDAWLTQGGTSLSLEPRGLNVPGCPFLTLADSPNHHVEQVVPSHPVFKDLSQEDFDTWAENPCGFVTLRGIVPLTRGVLAAKGRYIGRSPYASVLTEHAVGKGRIVVSSFAALDAFGANPAATRYLRNLFDYVTDVSRRVAHDRLPAFDDVAKRPMPADLKAEPLVIVPTSMPVRIDFKATASRKDAPWKIFFFTDRRQKVAEKGYRYLTVTFKSDDAGRVDLTIPRQDHSNRLTCTFPTSVSGGKPVTLRLDLAKDFRFAKDGTFGLDEIRGEIIAYNGYEMGFGERRPSVGLEILELKFE